MAHLMAGMLLCAAAIPLPAQDTPAPAGGPGAPASPSPPPAPAVDKAAEALMAKRAAEEKADAAYDTMIRSIFAGDSLADIRVTFGYDDAAKAREVNDPVRAERFMRSLKALGFQDYKVNEKAAQTLGVPMDAPNLRVLIGGTRKNQMLRVALMWSALSKKGSTNIGLGYSDQLKRSEEAMDFTKKACAEAEVMIYVGHSRGGGGPDTYPPETKVSGGGGSTDFAYYRKKRPGMNALGPHLRKLNMTPKLVSWTGCLSDSHFRTWFADCFSKKAQDTGVILSTRLTSYTPWEDAVEGLDEGVMVTLAIIQSLQEGDTREKLKQRLYNCEMVQLRDLDKPAWKLSMLPGASATPTPAPAPSPAPAVTAPASLAVEKPEAPTPAQMAAGEGE